MVLHFTFAAGNCACRTAFCQLKYSPQFVLNSWINVHCWREIHSFLSSVLIIQRHYIICVNGIIKCLMEPQIQHVPFYYSLYFIDLPVCIHKAFVFMKLSYLCRAWHLFSLSPIFQTLYKTQVRELKEECEERNKLYKEVQQSLQELQEERWFGC